MIVWKEVKIYKNYRQEIIYEIQGRTYMDKDGFLTDFLKYALNRQHANKRLEKKVRELAKNHPDMDFTIEDDKITVTNKPRMKEEE